MTETDKEAWDAGEHEGCGKDTERAVLKFSTTLEEVLYLRSEAERLRTQLARAQSVQPVAWRWRHSSSAFWKYGDDRPGGPSVGLFEVEPLYRGPRTYVRATLPDDIGKT